jgi:hypothetical protein
MTAIGFFFIAAAYLIGILDNYFNLPDATQAVAGFCILAGVPLTAFGVLTWLWRVMP